MQGENASRSRLSVFHLQMWSNTDNLFDSSPSHWTGTALDLFSAVRVDGVSYQLMGDATKANGTIVPAVQQSVVVWATQTVYSFVAGSINVNVTFTSPKLTVDWELFSRPAHYVTYSVASLDGKNHAVQLSVSLCACFLRRSRTPRCGGRRGAGATRVRGLIWTCGRSGPCYSGRARARIIA